MTNDDITWLKQQLKDMSCINAFEKEYAKQHFPFLLRCLVICLDRGTVWEHLKKNITYLPTIVEHFGQRGHMFDASKTKGGFGKWSDIADELTYRLKKRNQQYYDRLFLLMKKKHIYRKYIRNCEYHMHINCDMEPYFEGNTRLNELLVINKAKSKIAGWLPMHFDLYEALSDLTNEDMFDWDTSPEGGAFWYDELNYNVRSTIHHYYGHDRE